MHDQQAGRVFGIGFHGVFAIHTDFFAVHIRADIGVLRVNAVLGFLADDLFFEIARVGIVVLPNFGRSGQRGFVLRMNARREEGGQPNHQCGEIFEYHWSLGEDAFFHDVCCLRMPWLLKSDQADYLRAVGFGVGDAAGTVLRSGTGAAGGSDATSSASARKGSVFSHQIWYPRPARWTKSVW